MKRNYLFVAANQYMVDSSRLEFIDLLALVESKDSDSFISQPFFELLDPICNEGGRAQNQRFLDDRVCSRIRILF